MKIRYLVFLGVALAAPASAQIVNVIAQGPYIQAGSGMTYPEAVGDFHRVSVMQYKPDGSDVSAGYLRDKLKAEIVATAYSFPSPPPAAQAGQSAEQAKSKTCGAVAAGVVKSVQTTNPSAALVQANLVNLSQMGATQNGFHALFTMTAPKFMERGKEAVKSEAYVYCYAAGKWTVEYRFTYPAATADASTEIASFMKGLTWTFAQ